MKKLKIVSTVFLIVCAFLNLSYGQRSKDRFRQNKVNTHTGVDKVTIKNNVTAKPSMITSILSTAVGMQIKFKVADKKTTRILIYRRDMEENNFIVVESIKPNNRKLAYSFTDKSRNMKQATQYCYLIKTWVKGQSTGTPSKGGAQCRFFDGQFKAVPRPKNPEDLKVADVTSNSVSLTFIDRSNNEKYFFLERKAPHHKEWTVTEVIQRPKRDRGGNSEISVENSSLEMEQNYHYRVRAVNSAGSSVSNTIGVKTFPIEIGIGTVQLTHPSKNILQVAWVYTKADKPEWEVSLYNIDDDQNSIKKNLVKGNQKRMTSFDNLDPSKEYCIVVRKKGIPGSSYRKVCDSPFAKRSLAEHTGPVVPTIRSIERVSASELKVHLNNEMEGQLVDLVYMETGERKTITAYRNGAKTLRIVGLRHGERYCIRIFTTNEYGTRYSPRKCQSTVLNAPSKPFVTDISNEHVITVEWTSFGADEHTFEFSGTKTGAPDHNGSIKLDPPYDYIEFQSKPNYSYCFRVRSKNENDITDWSGSLCGITSEEHEEVISFGSSLIADIPLSGNIIYLGEVSPGNSSRLRKVHVAGNAFTPYIVQFLPVGKTREDCGSNVGVFVEPGNDLVGTDLNTLYGSNEPKTPVFFGACKIAKPNKQISTNPIPIQIDYVKD